MPVSAPTRSAPSTLATVRTRVAVWARSEPTGGLLLGVATIAALLLANAPTAEAYARVRDFAFGPAALHLHLTVGEWASDGLLALFFFVVGVELKREFVAGELSSPARAVVPVVAAVGGVVAPVLVYLAVVTAAGDADAVRGWAVPAATDIAFAVAVLALVARGLPAGLRTFLLTLAVVDDLIAITIIAVGYAQGIDVMAMVAAGAGVGVFAVLVRRWPVWWLLVPVAALVWMLAHASGVHATIAGVALGLAVPVFAAGRRPGLGADRWTASADGPAARAEHALNPWSSCVAVPVFAFFAAGVTLDGLGGFVDAVTTPVSLAIIAGLVVGKPVGIAGATFLVTRLPRVGLHPTLQWPDLVGVAMLGGVGFTVSLLVGELAFGAGSVLDDHANVGVLVGSLTAAILALVVLLGRVRSHRRRGVDVR